MPLNHAVTVDNNRSIPHRVYLLHIYIYIYIYSTLLRQKAASIKIKAIKAIYR